jgi:hypothetical protein
MGPSQTLICALTVVPKTLSSRTGSACAFVPGRKSLAHNGKALLKIQYSGMDAWQSQRPYGRAQVVRAPIMDPLLDCCGHLN